MGLDPISSIADLIKTGLEKFIPNADEKMKQQFAKAAREIELEYQTQISQLEINKIEAANPSIFVSGCRPAAMWVCVAGLAYTVGYPILVWGSSLLTITPPPPLDTAYLSYLLGALLGLGGMRSFDKSKGVDTKGFSL